ncbi:MAG: hypothetical protein ACI4IQ_03490 [Eubacterium sp.]
MKTYIFMFAFADYVSGGPIYDRNKITYLKERGWRIIVIPLNEGKVYIQGLEEYNKNSCPFLYDSPAEYTSRQRKKMLDILESRVPKDSTDIIIETGTDHTAYWGELLARRLKAKHFIMLLDENNTRLKSVGMPFVEFKYNRGELACINPKTMIKLFDGYKKLDDDKAYSLKCWCVNSVSDYENSFTDIIERKDYNIGYIGRPDKKFVPKIIKGICEFADSVKPKQVMVAIFGGCDSKIIKEIENTFKQHPNISVYISGYMWPLPLKALRKCDMFVSAAGSALASARAGVPTLAVDIYSGEPVGIIDDLKKSYLTSDIKSQKSIADYISQALVEEQMPLYESYDYAEEWRQICLDFDKHMDFINASNKKREWFDTQTLAISRKQKLKKLMRAVLGIKLFNNLVDSKRGMNSN